MIAIAADLELRRRHPGMQIEPLCPHPDEADGITHPEDPNPPREDQAAPSSQREKDGRRALGLTLQAACDEIPAQVLRIRGNAKVIQAKLDVLTSQPLPAPGEDDLSPGLAWPVQAGHHRGAVLQPPRPEVFPSARVMERHGMPQRASGRREAEPG